MFKNSGRIHAENYAEQVGGNVVEGAGWGYHVQYNDDAGYHTANFKKGSNRSSPSSIETYGNDLAFGHSLEMGDILEVVPLTVLGGLTYMAEEAGMSDESAQVVAGGLMLAKDIKSLKINKIADDAKDFTSAIKGWITKPSKKGGGTIFQDPKNPHNNIRQMPGNPNSPNPAQQNPYTIFKKEGVAYDVNGNPVNASDPAAHIPTSEFNINNMPKFD